MSNTLELLSNLSILVFVVCSMLAMILFITAGEFGGRRKKVENKPIAHNMA